MDYGSVTEKCSEVCGYYAPLVGVEYIPCFLRKEMEKVGLVLNLDEPAE